MSIELGTLGWTASNHAGRPNKVVLPLNDGVNAYVVTLDGEDVRVWKVNSNTNAFTQVFRNNLGTLEWPANQFSADLFSDNSIGIVYRRANGDMQYRKINQSGWTMSAAETVGQPASTTVIASADITITDGDTPVICWMANTNSNPKLQLITKVRNSSGSWVTATDQAIMTGNDPKNAMVSVAVQAVKGGTASARPVMVAIDSAQQGGDDHGCRVYTFTVNESTGAVVNFTNRKTYMAGDQSTSLSYYPRRTYLFPSATGEITLARMETATPKKMGIAILSFNGNTFAETMPLQTGTAPADVMAAYYGGAAYSQNAVTFFYSLTTGSVVSTVSYVGKINRATNTVRYSGNFKFDNLENTAQDRIYPMGGTGRNSHIATRPHMAVIGRQVNGTFNIRYHTVGVAPAPTAVTPGGTGAITGTPDLGLRIRLGKAHGQVRYKGEWQFALDAGFNSSVKTYTQDDSKLIAVDNTAATGSYVFIGDKLPESMSLTSGTWFVRARVVDEYGQAGAWSGANSTSYSHPPVAINLTPSAGAVISDAAVTFSWKFTDPLATDTQTAFQIIVERNDNGATVYDSGKIDTVSETHITQLDESLLGVLLQWRIRLWDADNAAGPYSPVETFMVAGPPALTVMSPTPGSALASGTPAILFSATVSGDRRITAYQVTITSAGKVVKASGMVAGDWASGAQILWRAPMPLLMNGSYEAMVTVYDQAGMTDTEGPIPFTVNAVSPATASGVTVAATDYNVEGRGYVSVTWTNASRDANFEAWVVSRKSDMLSFGTTVAEEGEWEEVAVVYDDQAAYEYRDYVAPSGYKVNYQVAQLVNRNGDRAISQTNNIRTAYPVSDGYWIIEPIDPDTGQTSAFQLHNVTGDSFTPEYEESEYVIIGRGRKNDRGDYLGVKGSLSAQLRDTSASTARQKRMALEEARGIESHVYLRNPFGDVYAVNLGNINMTRIAGVGRDEFVDVEIPYSEVSK